MKCYFCALPILAGQTVNDHHIVYRSRGGTETAPAHQHCHVNHHSTSGDFKSWGRIGGQITAITRRWSFNLRNVRNHPAYEMDRAYYLALYSQPGRLEVRV
jgi:hypothetical protein